MHEIQQKLLKMAGEKNLGKYTLREIGGFVGEESPQKIKHHLQQLEKKGFLRIDKANGMVEKVSHGVAHGFLKGARLLTIPILGSANAGPATIFAEANIQGYLRVSSTLMGRRSEHRIFALKVDGPSMNKAEVNGKKIEDGDYIVIDSGERHAKDGDIVLSVIDGMANVKKFYVDKENNQILLMSDSTQDFPAIHIHQDDDFSINGKVIGVIKTPRRKRK